MTDGCTVETEVGGTERRDYRGTEERTVGESKRENCKDGGMKVRRDRGTRERQKGDTE